MRNSQYYELDILHLLGQLWRRLWLIVIAGLLFGGGGFAFSTFVVTPKYEAETLMYVNNTSASLGNTSFSISSSELTAAQSLADTYIIILKARTTLNEVIEKEDLDYTYEELYDMISSDAVNGTEVFSICVTSEDPEEAKNIANAIARILPDKISGIVDGSSVRVVDYAVTPSESVGFLGGALLVCIIIVIRTLLDTLIHDEDYIIQTYDFPILAVIPDHTKSSEKYKYNNSKGTINKTKENK